MFVLQSQFRAKQKLGKTNFSTGVDLYKLH